MPSFVTHLACPRCGSRHEPGTPQNLCACESPLLVENALLGREAGISAAPEGAATLAATIALRERGELRGDETVVLVNTGSALKYRGPSDGRSPADGCPPGRCAA